MERDRHHETKERPKTSSDEKVVFVDPIEQLRQQLAKIKPNKNASTGVARAHRKMKAVKRRR